MAKYRVYGEEHTVLFYDELIEANSKREAYDNFLNKIVRGEISGWEDHYDYDIRVDEIKDEQPRSDNNDSIKR